VATQDLLDVLLRDAVRQLGRAPRTRQPSDPLARLAGRRQAKPRKLIASEPGEVSDVGGKVIRQADTPHLGGEPQPTVVLHRPRLRCVRLRVKRRRWLGIDHRYRHASPSQFDGKHQPERPASHDNHAHHNGSHSAHFEPGSAATPANPHFALIHPGPRRRPPEAPRDRQPPGFSLVAHLAALLRLFLSAGSGCHAGMTAPGVREARQIVQEDDGIVAAKEPRKRLQLVV
jgi:hypothetical protein